MRILFTTTPGARNFGPVRTFAQAWQRLGHRGAWSSSTAAASRHGVRRRTRLPAAGSATCRLDLKLALRGHRRAPIEAVKPDLIVHETAEYATVLAGEATGSRWPGWPWSAAPRSWPRRPSPPPPSTRCARELGPGARSRGRAHPLRARHHADPRRAGGSRRARHARALPRAEAVAAPAARPLGRRHVAARPPLARRAARWRSTGRRSSSSRRCEMRVLVSLGAGQDPAELGPLPAGAHVNPGMPLIDTMPYTAVLVCDGASSTLTAGLSCGVPMVSVPLSSGQSLNAARDGRDGRGPRAGRRLRRRSGRWRPRCGRCCAARTTAGGRGGRRGDRGAPAGRGRAGALAHFSLNARMRSSYCAASRA